ncbi:hypothetical protein C2E23DRAFT_738930 [Lenzites betulinus]|nr:hypothetical protein C2E23DRAFT_738930 [Lenzites betulinus]
MPETWIETPDQLEHALHYWKNYTFSDSYTNLQDAVDTVNTSDNFLQARQVYPSRWLCLKDSKGVEEAIFHTAAIYRWGTNDETGNFVLSGKQAESGVPDRTEPSTLCQFSYGIDTHRDKTIWKAQKAFEEYVAGVQGFNKAQKKRRPWQDGTTAEKPNSMFVFNSQVFVKRNQATKHREAHIPYELHDWIKAVTVDSPRSEYFANPDRPALLEPQQGQLCSIKKSSPPAMQKGDLVWMSFSVQFIIGSDTWSTTFVPYEIVRVGTVAQDLVGEPDRPAAIVEAAVPRGRLQVGMKVDMRA